MSEIRDVTLREMVTAMAHLPNETVFRWYQTTIGGGIAGDTLRITLGQLRKELGVLK